MLTKTLTTTTLVVALLVATGAQAGVTTSGMSLATSPSNVTVGTTIVEMMGGMGGMGGGGMGGGGMGGGM